MTYFTRLATYQTKSRRVGHPRELTAKLGGNLVVFAGSQSGQQSINADADITIINARWFRYCADDDGDSLFGLSLIERTTIDAARGK